jgi:predicted nucleotidyltransferase
MSSDVARTGVRRTPSLAMLRAHKDEILRLASRRGVSNIRVFGSVARGDATPDSDIDLLVDFEVRDSGLDLFAFAREVEELLGHPVDVGTDVHRVIQERVEAQAVPL